MKSIVDIDDLLSRGVGEYIDPSGTFRKKLTEEPENIVIKFGVDPTRPDLHLGHAVVLRKLRQFQNLGCKVIFLVGDLTSSIGDPTGKSKIRPEISQRDIEANMQTYLEQVGKVLKTDPAVFSWIRNSDWFVSINDLIGQDDTRIPITVEGQEFLTPPLPADNILVKANAWVTTRMQKGNIRNYSLIGILSVLRKISHSRLIERDMFQERIKKGEPIFMHELMYPILQGIDSNVLHDIYGACDLEVGGTDQHFNMLVGRDIMQMNNKIPQAVLSFRLLEGTDGSEKMSKSLDNYVGLTDEPADMYGKIMSIPDSSITNYYELCTYTPLERVKEIQLDIADGSKNPRDYKMELAKQIVAEYHGAQAAESAEADFIAKFQKKEIPEEIQEISGSGLLVDVLLTNEFVTSKSEFRRLVEGGAVTILETKEKITDPAFLLTETVTLKIGKHTFLRIVQ